MIHSIVLCISVNLSVMASRKTIFGLLLLVTSVLMITLMYYNDTARTTVQNNVAGYFRHVSQSESQESLPQNFQKNKDVPNDPKQKKTKKFAKVQLELLEILAKQDVKVTSEESSYFSPDSVLSETSDTHKQKGANNKVIKDLTEQTNLSYEKKIDNGDVHLEEVEDKKDVMDESSDFDNDFPDMETVALLGRTESGNFQSNNKTRIINQPTSKSNRLINCYDWYDGDVEAWKYLPLKSGQDYPQGQERVIFNRVGKCGSRTMIVILRQLSTENNFNLISSTVYNNTHINIAWQERLVDTLDEVQTPFLFQRHLHYVDFTRYGSQPPVYINIIRDPLARMVSQYYFKRFGDGRNKQRFNGPKEEQYQTFDDCVLQRKRECVGPKAFYIIPFFCGQDKKCRKPSMWALEMAIQNVEEKFLFVGILEEFEDTLAVLEQLLPSIFRKAVYFYKNPSTSQDDKNMSSTVTINKKKPSYMVESIMKEQMKFEYQFYNYVKEKFYKIRDKLGIKPST